MKFRRAIDLLDRRIALLAGDAPDADRRLLAEESLKQIGFQQDVGWNAVTYSAYPREVERARALVEPLLARSRGGPEDAWRHEFAGRLDLYQAGDAREGSDLAEARRLYTRAVERLGAANRMKVGW